MDFNVNVNAKVNGLEQVESLEKKIDSLSKTQHKISLSVDFDGQNNVESLLKVLSNGSGITTAGKKAGIQFSKGFSTAKFTPDIIDYGKMKKAAKLEVEKISTDMKKGLSDVTTKDTNKWANQYVSDRNKAYKQSLKEQETYQKNMQKVVAQQKKIEVQQQIAEMKQNAISKNSHHDDLVNQGKANIEKWTFDRNKAYKQSIKEYNTEYQNLKTTLKQIGDYDIAIEKLDPLKNGNEINELISQREKLEQVYSKDFSSFLDKSNNDPLVQEIASMEKLIELDNIYEKSQNKIAQIKAKQSDLNEQELLKSQDKRISEYKAEENRQNKIQNSLYKKFEDGDFSSTSSKMKSALSQYEKQDFESLSKAKSYFKEYTSITDNLSKHYNDSDPFLLDTSQLEDYSKKLPTLKKQFTNAMSEVRSESSKTASELTKLTKSNEVMSYYNSNTKMHKDFGQSFLDIAESYKAATTEGQIQEITARYKELKSAISAKGLEGKSLFDEISRGFRDIAQFTITYGILQKIPDVISQSVSELKDLNSILTEISKTSDATNAELKELGNDSFKSASKYGQKASSYLLGVQEMNRSGYYGEQGAAMAELSVLAQAAGDMSADMSNSYLLATNAAYQYQGSVEKLNDALDGQNMISNRNSVSMADMAQATSEAASMAAQTGVEIDQLSAMIGTIESRTKSGGSEVGNAIKAILINLQNTSSDKIVDTLDAAGASMTEYVNGAEQLRNPIEILKDLAETYNSLDEADPLKSEILTNIGQKYHANKLSALLTGWSDYEKMLTDYSQGMGSAAIEAEKSASNWEGSLNKLSNSFTDLIANFADADKITSGINFITTMVSGVDTLSEYISNLGTIGGAFGVFTDLKGVG